MIDFHTHILPGIDDGSKSLEESIEMLREESRQGVSAVVLSSHFYAAQNSIQDFLKNREKAWKKLQSRWTPDLPKLYLGAEVQYFEGISVAEGIHDLCIEGTDLLLVEMPFNRWPERVIQDVLSLNARKDIQIVLAHIDRYLPMQPLDIWPWLQGQGILMQANTAFFQDFWSRRRAIRMAQKGLIHMLGTDCHSISRRRPDWSKVPQKVLSWMEQEHYLEPAAVANL